MICWRISASVRVWFELRAGGVSSLELTTSDRFLPRVEDFFPIRNISLCVLVPLDLTSQVLSKHTVAPRKTFGSIGIDELVVSGCRFHG